MEIIQKKVTIKLDQDERNSFVHTVVLLENMRNQVNCDECPFKERCDKVSESECLLNTLIRDLKYINNNCD